VRDAAHKRRKNNQQAESQGNRKQTNQTNTMLIIEQLPTQYTPTAITTTPCKATTPKSSKMSKAKAAGGKKAIKSPLASTTNTAEAMQQPQQKIDVAEFLSMFATAATQSGSQSDGDVPGVHPTTPKSTRPTAQHRKTSATTQPKKVASMPNTSLLRRQTATVTPAVQRAASFTDAHAMIAKQHRTASTIMQHPATPTRMQAFATPAYAHSPSAKDVPPPPVMWTCEPISVDMTINPKSRLSNSHSLQQQMPLMTKPLTGLEFISAMQAATQ
jgi:hypothetical protein